MKIAFEISDSHFDLLKKIDNEKFVEYRDTEYETLEEFKDSDVFKNGLKDENWFLKRNGDGTYHLTSELESYGLIESDGDSWHLTYILTEFGKKVVNDNK
jgi:hypothetical protein